jgi:sugar lactone lactonase YvrE
MKRFSTLLFLLSGLFFSACSKKSDNTTPTGPVVIDHPSTVTTIAGSGTQGFADGTKEQASFNQPTGIAVSNLGFIFVADKQNNRIRLVTPQGVVNTIAGTGKTGSSNKKDSVTFNFPSGVGVDAAGNVYVADLGSLAIRKIDITDVVNTFATGVNGPTGLASDAAGNVYVADNGNSVIDKISPKGVVTLFAGSVGVRGSKDGTGSGAQFNQPQSVAVDSSGNVYVADAGNNMIRKINSQGVVTTIAGSTTAGNKNAAGTAASFNRPTGVAVDGSGNVYVADANNNMIRKIATNGTVTTIAGTGVAGNLNGTTSVATFNDPQGVAVDLVGRIVVADTGNGLIRIIQVNQ